MTQISTVYCDKIVCTSSPESYSQLGLAFNELVESCGGRTERYEDGYREIRMPENGSIILQQNKNWSRISINGKACAELRLLKRFNEALGIIGTVPHKVTQLHTKVDYRTDSTPKVLKRLDKLAKSGLVFALDYTKCQTMPVMRPDRQISNNLYAPKVQAEKQVCYYDKTLERHVKGFLPEWLNGSMDENLSVELRLSGRVTRKGLSLRDASEPEPMFWNYMVDCPIIGKYRPVSVPEWSSIGSEYHYDIKKRTDDEKLTDLLRFGGDYLLICKLAVLLGRESEVTKEVARAMKNCKVLQ
jgi:hypothetical protein